MVGSDEWNAKGREAARFGGKGMRDLGIGVTAPGRCPLFALFFSLVSLPCGTCYCFSGRNDFSLAPVRHASRKKFFPVGFLTSVRHAGPFLTWVAQPQGVAHTDGRKLGWDSVATLKLCLQATRKKILVKNIIMMD
jgi:hypothetical protein